MASRLCALPLLDSAAAMAVVQGVMLMVFVTEGVTASSNDTTVTAFPAILPVAVKTNGAVKLDTSMV
jgi:hypothetical protein